MERDWTNFKSLYGGVEGARANFEIACETVLRLHHSGQHVQQVAASHGDGGIDVCVGYPGQAPVHVYQCKFFLDQIGDAQKQQIKKSFTTAFSNSRFSMHQWTLCLPKVLTLDEQIWWAAWRQEIISENGLSDDFITLHSGNDLIVLMKKHDVYNVIFKMNEALMLNEIYNWIHKFDLNDLILAAELKNNRTSILNAIDASINTKFAEVPKPANPAIFEIQFYKDVEIDYVTLKKFIYNAYNSGVNCNDLLFTIARDSNYEILKDNLRKNLELLKSGKSFSTQLIYSLIEISQTIESAERGLLRGIKDIICNLYSPGRMHEGYFDDCIYWFAKIMRHGTISKLHAYQLTAGFISEHAKEYSWFSGRFFQKDDFIKFYNENKMNVDEYRACFNHDINDYVRFYLAKDFFSQLTAALYYKYGLPQIMELLTAMGKEKIFWTYDEVKIYRE